MESDLVPLIKRNESVNLTPLMHNEGLVTITYDQMISYDDSEISGFYYCCTAFDSCDDDNWVEISEVYEVGSNFVSSQS